MSDAHVREAFERGFISAFAEATVANDCEPPFELTDAIMEKAWQNRDEGCDQPLSAASRSAASVARGIAAEYAAALPHITIQRARTRTEGAIEAAERIAKAIEANGEAA